jgi:hypothetical protein
MDAHAHPHLSAVGPRTFCERPLRGRGRLDRVACPGEYHEEGLGLSIHDDSVVGDEGLLQQSPVFGNDLVVSVTEAVLELGRSLDVREEERDRSLRQLAHAEIVTATRANRKGGVR